MVKIGTIRAWHDPLVARPQVTRKNDSQNFLLRAAPADTLIGASIPELLPVREGPLPSSVARMLASKFQTCSDI